MRNVRILLNDIEKWQQKIALQKEIYANCCHEGRKNCTVTKPL